MKTLIIRVKRTKEIAATITRTTKKACTKAARASFPQTTYSYEWEAA